MLVTYNTVSERQNLKIDLKNLQAFVKSLHRMLLFYYVPPPEESGEGGQIDFSVDPVGVGVGVGVGVLLLVPTISLEQLVEFHQTCRDKSLGQA